MGLLTQETFVAFHISQGKMLFFITTPHCLSSPRFPMFPHVFFAQALLVSADRHRLSGGSEKKGTQNMYAVQRCSWNRRT